MDTYIGIDLGTSGVKLLLVDEKGTILKEVSKNYPCIHIKENYSEQDPQLWYEKTIEALKELLDGQDKSALKAMSFGGQMHGLVMLDKDDDVLRPAILWNDSRSSKETNYLNNVIGKDKLSLYTGNIAFAGFTAPKILWVYDNERDIFNKTTKIMLPKDYLIYKFTGMFATDVSDASGFLLLDVKNRTYSKEMLDICHIKEEQLPKLYESFEVVGNLNKSILKELGLNHEVKVIAGAGDNAAAAIGTGTIGNGNCNISLGTSGTIFLSSDHFTVDKMNSLHSFCDASNKYHLMGCILAAASARSWWLEQILNTKDYDSDEKSLEDSNVVFLPYLNGERSPHNDVDARGAFINLSSTTTRGQMSKAILEGVAFAIKDCLEIAKENGIVPLKTTICGGGAKSETWKHIIADVLEIPVYILKTNQGPSYGAAILAMVGDKKYASVEDAVKNIVKTERFIEPNLNNKEYYDKKYSMFRKLYPALKSIRD